MVRIGQKAKVLLAFLMPLIFISLSFVVFAHFRIRIFYGERSDALNALNGVVQSLSAIVAIVFTIIIVVVQTTLGRFIARAAWYVISDWINILMLFLYVCTITIALWTMWNIGYEFWTLWMDVTMASSLVCLGALIPFFLRMPQSLKPTLIMTQVKNEILDACHTKDFSLVSDRTNLLFSMTKKAIETGDVEYAFEGFKLFEEVIKYEDARENEFMLFNLILSLLDDLAIKIVSQNLNVALRIFDIYARITDKTKKSSFMFANIINRVAQSIVEVSVKALPNRFVNQLLLKGSHIIIVAYKDCILLDWYVPIGVELEQHLREVLTLGRDTGAFDGGFPVGFPANLSIMELLKNGKANEALRMSEVIYGEATGSAWVKLSIIGLILDSKVEGFDDFASKTLEVVKKKFAPFKINVVHDPQKKGGGETSVGSDGSTEIKTGDKKREEAALWMRQNLTK